MSTFTRREFLGTTALATCATLLNSSAFAGGATQLTRYDARSVQGKQMLAKYAQAVAMMKALPDSDPKSWTFQWYMHSVPFLRNGVATDKAMELMRVFPAASPAKQLAIDAWETCQAHHQGDVEDYFLPWHRLFVGYFEKIIRNVLADSTFTLPYWDYTIADTAGMSPIHGIIPDEFRMQNHPVFGSLYVAERRSQVNAGAPIHQGLSVDPLNLDDLTADTYQGDAGFCSLLDGNLHGTVHVRVGNSFNMGRVPFAGRDPIFWLHHCNIDRLWASWNAAGNSNPMLNQIFVFADADGNRVEGNVGSVMDMSTMDYKYDRLESVPQPPPPDEAVAKTARIIASTVKTTEADAEPIKLGAAPIKIAMNMIPAANDTPATPFLEHVKGLKPERKLSVLFKGLKAKAAPGIVYQVFLDLPAEPTPEQLKLHYVGTLNFFDAVGHDNHTQENANSGMSKPVPMRITKVAKTLREKNMLAAKPTLVIIPQGTAEEGAMPTIKEVQIVEH